MSVLPVGIGSSGGYEITNSVRLRASASAYFSRTFGTPTSATTWAFSCQIKRGLLTVAQSFIDANTSGIYFDAGDKIAFKNAAANVATSTALYRDPSAHGHLFVNSNGTTVKAYWNNVEVLSYTGTITNLNTAIAHSIGRSTDSTRYLDGYLSDIYFIDGQALTPSSFGQTDSNGVWVPKAYSGTYGTNGFHLDFADAALTAGSNVGLGKDVSGNGNYWNTNNISLTAGVTYDSMVDTPTNNYATLNPLLYMGSGSTKADGNLRFVAGGTGGPPYNYSIHGTFVQSVGKHYWETNITTVGLAFVGIWDTSVAFNGGSASGGAGPVTYGYNGNYYNQTSGVAFGATYTSGDVIGVAVDFDNNLIWFSKNGTWQNSGDPAAGTNGKSFGSGKVWGCGLVESGSSASPSTFDLTFGQRPFTYTPPTGFKALCTANLPAVAIPKPAAHFNAKTRTGTGASFNVTGQAFQPDLVWTKGRSGATDHAIYDTTRGVQKQMESNTTSTETTEATGLTAFNADGFTGGALAQMNTNTATYIDWLWKAGGAPTTDNVAGAGATPTAGSVKIDGANLGSALAGSTAAKRLSANTVAGVSVVIWTAANNATIAHGLGAAPKLIIRMDRSVSHNHPVYHASMNATPQNGAMYLTLTNAYAADATVWNSTAPTSTTFSTGTDVAAGDSCVALCFAEIPGYSKFGSYVGNGSADGPFVYCGFEPRFVMTKASSTTGDWRIYDFTRPGYNVQGGTLLADTAGAETTTAELDLLSNGFKARITTDPNSAQTFIYAAFAAYPFGGSNVSPSPAR